MIGAAAWREQLERRVQGVDVKSAASLAALGDDKPRRDTIYTVRFGEEASGGQEGEVTLLPRQMITVRMAIIIAVTNFRDGRGAGGMDEIEVIRQQVQTALLGWQPAGAACGAWFEGGQMMGADKKAVAWWQEIWRLQELIRATNR